MKKSGFIFAALSLVAILLISWQTKKQVTTEMEGSDNHIVLVKYKAQSGKSGDAMAGLSRLIEAVSEEPHFVSITLHLDPSDDSNILLYEEWSDASYYNGDHMKTIHLQNFMTESRAYLSGPPEISQWKTVRKFNGRQSR
ncbi:MAG: antibiotic biosynthesis monooxygenase [Bacteroidales bacterium]|nr:antibiotic biosynthesis monooxygenase [Bacteroidales bacterium]